MKKYANRKDRNHKRIVGHLRAIGCYVLDVSDYPVGFDCIAFYRGLIHILEIKHPDVIPKSGDRAKSLTESEKVVKSRLESRKVPYHIVISEEEAQSIVAARGYIWQSDS